jgi:putative transposase
MPRIARVVLTEHPYDITQRGNAQQRIFVDDADCLVYLDLLRRYSAVYELNLWAYCLMPNHVHLVAVPTRGESMARALGRTHADYARYFDVKRGTCGHVWQARYYSCPLDEAHLWTAIAYVSGTR